MKIKAWPFLIGKNRQVGYRPVVVPDILYAANIPGRLDELRSNQLIEKPICKVIQIQAIGTVTVIYRVVYKTDSDRLYTDLQNRPILWSEGLLIEGNFADLELPPGVFQFLHQQLDAIAAKFYSDGQDAKTINAPPFEIELSARQVEENIRRLKEARAILKEQEKLLIKQLTEIDQQAEMGKKVTLIGIPLILILVGVVVIPIGLYISKSANEARKTPQEDLNALREQIKIVETELLKLEKDIQDQHAQAM